MIGRCFRQPHFSGVYVLANGSGTELAELWYNIDTRGNHGKPTILWLYNGISATKKIWSICVISPAMGFEPTTYEPCSKCLTSWHQIRKCLRHLTPLLTFCLRAHRFCLRAYLFLRWAYAGLRSPQFCLRHTLTRGHLLNMNTRV